MEPEFADRTVEQFIFLETERNVVVESERDIRGVLSQSQIGDMSSISRVAASCFRVIDAMYPPPSAASPTRIARENLSRSGTGSSRMRAVNALGSKPQQAALDLHPCIEYEEFGCSVRRPDHDVLHRVVRLFKPNRGPP